MGKNTSSLIGKRFDSGTVYGDSDKYIKTKTESNGHKVNTNFRGKNLPKDDAQILNTKE